MTTIIHPFETSVKASHDNPFVSYLSQYTQLVKAFNTDTEATRAKRIEYLERAEISLKHALNLARKIACIRINPEQHSNEEADSIRQFRLFLNYEAWNTGAFLVLYDNMSELDQHRAEDTYAYMVALREMLHSFFNGTESNNETSSQLRAQFVSSWNHLQQSFKAATRSSPSPTILKNFIRSLETMLDQIVANAEFVGEFSTGEKNNLLSQMIDSAKNIPDTAMDEEGRQVRARFLVHLEERISPRMHIGGELVNALLYRIERSIEMCQKYERASMATKALHACHEALRKIQGNIGRTVRKAAAQTVRNAAQSCAEVYANTSIWEPVKTAFKILGWIFVAPVLRICDAVNQTQRLADYNKSIADQWDKGKVGVVCAMLGILGCGALIGVADAVTFGAAVPLIGLGIGHTVGGVSLALGVGAGAYVGHQIREREIQAIREREIQAMLAIEAHKQQLITAEKAKQEAKQDIKVKASVLNQDPEFCALQYDCIRAEQIHVSAQVYRDQMRQQRAAASSSSSSSSSNSSSSASSSIPADVLYEGILNPPTTIEEFTAGMNKVKTKLRDSLDGVIADLTTKEAEAIIAALRKQIEKLNEEKRLPNEDADHDDFTARFRAYFGDIL